MITDYSIHFTNPWWFLLLIPAVALALIPYFRINKRYRRTRNRIVSMIMFLTMMLLATALLAGFRISHYTAESETEVILLVDASYSLTEDRDETDAFIKAVIEHCDSMYQLGIVKFGYDQVYAAELSKNTDKMFDRYLASADPDISATDLSAALTYTAALFTDPANARIVLLSDGQETDGATADAIKTLAAKGIHVDTVYLSGEDAGREVQIIDAVQSVPKVETGVAFEMYVTVQSSYEGSATITPYDNGVAGVPVEIELVVGKQTIAVPYSFAWGGMHIMNFEIAAAGDTLAQNNSYVSYIYIETFTELLVIESIENESESLVSMLGEELNVDVVNVSDTDHMPSSLEHLRNYDEILLVNVSNGDLPEGFDQILYEYVYTVGGGLFTVCGNEADSDAENWTANAYTREDMYGSLYQEMLPVEIVNYTPSVGVVIIIDTSGSMLGNPYEESKLYWAMQGARACLGALTERDYISIMTFASAYTEELLLTPRNQREKILQSITELEESAKDGTITSGGTVISPALERAGKALGARSDLEKKHIILVTDCQPSGDDAPTYRYWVQKNARMGITMSVVGIQAPQAAKNEMVDLLVNYAGCGAQNYHSFNLANYSSLPTVMRENLEVPEIKEVNYETFALRIGAYNSVTSGLLPEDMPTLDGYYGVKLKKGATAVLKGKYTPIYAQWSFGKGRVGTFACDLNGTWSTDFIESDTGKHLINRIIYALFPSENIRTKDIEATITGDNYKTNLSLFAELADGEYIQVTVTGSDQSKQVITAGQDDNFSRIRFSVNTPGLHTILIQKMDAGDQELASTTLYKALPYSKEYDLFLDTEKGQMLLESLAQDTKGTLITDPMQVFENAVEYHYTILDPRILFAIAMIVLLLVDVAARKFKWKWPHELIADRKRRQETMNEYREGSLK